MNFKDKKDMKMKNMLHTLSLCALLLLGAFTSSVWGRTTTVSVPGGHGEVRAQIYVYYAFKGWKLEKEATMTSNSSTPSTVTHNSGTMNSGYVVVSIDDGYSFDGWYIDAECENIKKKETDDPLRSSTDTYYAKFIPNNYTITLNDNGGSGGDGTHGVTFDAATGSLTNTPTQTGYTFTGYYTSTGVKIFNADGSPVQNVADYTDNTASKNWKHVGHITLYAHWTPIAYSVTLDNEGGSPSSSSVTLTYDSNTHEAITNPTKTDYTFAGWWTGDNGTGTMVIAADGTMQANVDGYTGEGGIWTRTITPTTLYAKWISNAKTITLNNQSATTAGTPSISVLYNKNNNLTGTPAITIPAKTNHTFEGYYTAVNGGGVQIIAANGNVNASVEGYTDGDKKWLKETDVTLYAYWKQNQTISWTQNFGSPVRSNVITLSASASSGRNVLFAVTENANLVTLEGNTLTCLKAGTVRVRAYENGNESWNATEYIRDVTIVEHAITTNPTASGTLTYEQTLNTISPAGGVTNVAGSWAWKYPTSVPVVGTANQVAVFTPNNVSGAFTASDTLQCNVSVTVNKANPDVTCTVNANTHYVDDTKIDLQSTWTREGDGTVTYTLLSFEESGENNDDGTDPYIESNRYLHLGKAGTAQVKMAIAAGTNYIARNETIEVVINKHDPAFAWNTQTNYYYNTTVNNFLTKTSGASYTVTSSDEEVANMDGANLKIYNKAGTTKIKYVHPQTYKWNEKKDSVTFTPEWKNNQLTLTVTEDNYTSVIENRYAGSSDRFRWLNGGVLLGSKDISLSDGAEGWDSRYIDIHFTGMPDSLSFTYERSVSTATGMVWWVKEKTENGEWSDETIWTASNASGSCKKALKPDTRWVRLRGYCNYGVYFRNIKITKREQFETDSTSFDFKTQIKNANVPSKSFKFKHANAGYTVTAASNDSHYKVSLNNSDFYSSIIIPNTGGDRMDSSVVYVKYYPSIAGDVEETHNATITFSDALSNSATVSLTGKTQAKLATHLEYIGSDSYSVNADNIAATTLFEVRDANNALVASPVIKLTSSDSTKIDIVQVDGKDYIDFLCGADDVRITASYAGDDDYAAASNSGTFYYYIDVTRNTDAVTWNNVKSDGKIHVWAGGDTVPLNAAGVNSTSGVTYSSNNTNKLYLDAYGKLRTSEKGEVTLTASSEGDCTYNSISGSKTVVVEPCIHEIVWDQDHELISFVTASDGTISETYDLNAYAVDSLGARTNKAINYSLASTSFASLSGNRLTITGTGETTITATTVENDTFATAVSEKKLRVRRYGTACGSYALNVATEKRFSKIDSNNDYVFNGIPDVLTCQVRKYTAITITGTNAYIKGWSKSQNKWVELLNIYKEVDNTTYQNVRYVFTPEQRTDITKITFTNSIEDGSKYVRNVLVTQLDTLYANKTNINRGDASPVMVNTPFSDTITVTYSDVPLIKARYTGQHLTLRPLQTVNNDCGEDGTYQYVLSGRFTKTQTAKNDTIYFTTSALDTVRIPVTIKVVTDGTFTMPLGTEGTWSTINHKWQQGGSDTELRPGGSSEVQVLGTLIIDTIAEAQYIYIGASGRVLVKPSAGLTVGSGGIACESTGVLKLEAADGATKSSTAGKTGYLRISPEYTGSMPNATIEMYSTAYYDMSGTGDDVAVWQCVGAPISDAGVAAKSVYTKSWIYSWDEKNDDWVNNRKTLTFTPFTGYITTQYKYTEGIKLTYDGHIVSGSTPQVIDLACSGEGKGHNLLANSYAAPIDISRLSPDDFYHATPAIYIQNAGTRAESSSQMGGTSAEKAAAPGQYLAIPVNTATSLASSFNYPILIPAMQGFWVDATADDGTLTLDYNRLVWNADYSTHPNVPLRAPKKTQEVAENESEEMPQTGSLQISLEANGWYDNLFMLESERYNTAYEPGSDALKKESGTLNIFTVENEDKLAIDATNSIIGTRVGVRTGEETAYTIAFSYVDGEQEWALYDAETNEMIDITNDNTYTFFAEPNSNITERFMIVEREGAPAVTTGNDKVTSDVRAHKFIKDSQLFILKNGVLYDATGARVK